MKKQILTKALSPSVLSLVTLGIFVLLALGSLEEFMHYDIQYLGNGVYEEKNYLDYENYEYDRTTGKRDDRGRWQGPVTISHQGNSMFSSSYEEVTMVDGKRHGTSKLNYYFLPNNHIVTKCYNMGVEIPCSKSAGTDQADKSAHQILGEKYSWYFFSLICFGFDSSYVESYLDTLETLLYAYEFEEDEFDSYYEEVLDSLSETPYDSLLILQETLFLFKGFEELKNAEFRLAVIDHYRSDGVPTYEIIGNSYTGYLQNLVGMGVPEEDFEYFCGNLDDSLAMYGPLDPEDPFYVDSIDAHMFRALSGFMESDLKSTVKMANRHSPAILKSMLSEAGSSDIAEYIIADMLTYLMQGDINRLVVREAYNLRKGMVTLPIVTTEFTGNASATSVYLQGYVIEDGGDGITDRGIAWAESYNPTVFDNTQASGSGTGTFAIKLDGLTEGITYYARTYAINSAGTAYGNCIEFVAQIPSGIQDIKLFATDFTVYPNPARASVTCSFRLGSPESMALTITDLKGRQVFYRDLGMLPRGENRITLDLSGLGNGLYNCRLTNGTVHVVQKLEIVR
jgi:hypothetical protein